MKKFWVVLLSLGLIAAFCMPAAALDVKMGGNYIVTGMYEDNRSLVDKGEMDGDDQATGSSMAFYMQRLRMEPVFKVAEGLNFNLRIDAMQRVWGRSGIGSETDLIYNGARNDADEQNIQFRRGWVDFITKIGAFKVGYMADALWGTDFGDISSEGPQIVYMIKTGPFLWVAATEKISEGRLGGGSATPTLAPGYTDSDSDKYCLFGYYFWQGGEAGLLWCRVNAHGTRPNGVKSYFDTYRAYFKASKGGLYAEGEFEYLTGKKLDWEDGYEDVMENVEWETYQWYLMARYTIGPTYLGAQYAHSSGDDLGSDDEDEQFPAGGNVWQPTLILWNDWIQRYAGNVGHSALNYTSAMPGASKTNQVTNRFANADLYQFFAGWKPTPKLHIKGSFTMAWADEKPLDCNGVEFVDDEIGQELDLTVSYKIFDNLEYMVGFAYLWTGDYFKGGYDNADVDDDYLVLHQLTLTF